MKKQKPVPRDRGKIRTILGKANQKHRVQPLNTSDNAIKGHVIAEIYENVNTYN